ncbi:MAG: response regulator transcription factor [Candidatus Wallbacteria bacterium]|nr:response regulator transcription factor [Candidatus Wallbacteria bacterium]
MQITVTIADDHDLIRLGIKTLIEKKAKDITVTGEASNGEEVLALAKTNPTDVYILDISMPGLNGIDAIPRILRISPLSRIIILSMHDNRALVEKAMLSGARGYLLKTGLPDEIIKAIRTVSSDKFYLSPSITKYIVEGFLKGRAECRDWEGLSQRERETAQLIAEGFSSKEIAARFKITVNTVNWHRKNIMEKLGLHKQSELTRWAISEGLIDH